MNVQLFRIDDRLIHGQVVIGWVNFLGPKEIILCDDSVAENDWEKELYLSVVPETLQARVLTVKELANLLLEGQTDLSKTIIIINTPDVLEQLLKLQAPINNINLGGMHFKEPRKQYLSYLYLSDEEVACFKRIHNQGVIVFCQDVPNAKKRDIVDVLAKR